MQGFLDGSFYTNEMLTGVFAAAQFVDEARSSSLRASPTFFYKCC
jgi:hypothetical protein